MLNVLAPFDTYFREHEDHNPADSRAECEALFQRQQFVEAMLAGTIPVDDLLELLFEQDIDPNQYIDAAIDNIDYVIDNAIEIDPDEVKLILPLSLCPGRQSEPLVLL